MRVTVLTSHLEGDSRKTCALFISSIDASVVFGFGATVAPCSEDVALGASAHEGVPMDEPENRGSGRLNSGLCQRVLSETLYQ